MLYLLYYFFKYSVVFFIWSIYFVFVLIFQFCQHSSNVFEKGLELNLMKCHNGARQYCGDVILPSEFEEVDKTFPYSPNAFQEPLGDLGVKIFLANTPVLHHESLGIEIAFTAYKRMYCCYFLILAYFILSLIVFGL